MSKHAPLDIEVLFTKFAIRLTPEQTKIINTNFSKLGEEYDAFYVDIEDLGAEDVEILRPVHVCEEQQVIISFIMDQENRNAGNVNKIEEYIKEYIYGK